VRIPATAALRPKRTTAPFVRPDRSHVASPHRYFSPANLLSPRPDCSAMDAIATYLERYNNEFDHYERAAALCGDRCRELLRESGILAIVTHRAKQPDRLRAKLDKQNRDAPFGSEEDIRAWLKDQAGVRIALYFPGDADRVEGLLRDSFNVLDTKPFPQEPNKTPGASLPDEPADAMPVSGYKPRFFGYCATHYIVYPKAEVSTPARFTHTRVEIQVASVLMHAWSEVEHDLIYKRLQGPVSEDEHALIDHLNGLVAVGEQILRQLQKTIRDRIARLNEQFADQYDVAAFLLRSADVEVRKGPFEIRLGQMDLLLEFLRGAGLDTPQEVAQLLAQIGAPSPDDSWSQHIAREAIKANEELEEVYAAAFLANRGQSGSRGDTPAFVLIREEVGARRMGRMVVGRNGSATYWIGLNSPEEERFIDEHQELLEGGRMGKVFEALEAVRAGRPWGTAAKM
jgi:ppGpp synthetase/RelA/SpoT-type nucleotidyltranferase